MCRRLARRTNCPHPTANYLTFIISHISSLIAHQGARLFRGGRRRPQRCMPRHTAYKEKLPACICRPEENTPAPGRRQESKNHGVFRGHPCTPPPYSLSVRHRNRSLCSQRCRNHQLSTPSARHGHGQGSCSHHHRFLPCPISDCRIRKRKMTSPTVSQPTFSWRSQKESLFLEKRLHRQICQKNSPQARQSRQQQEQG